MQKMYKAMKVQVRAENRTLEIAGFDVQSYVQELFSWWIRVFNSSLAYR
jgi:hypothetical protein